VERQAMGERNKLLDDLLVALIRRWGHRVVRDHLEKLPEEGSPNGYNRANRSDNQRAQSYVQKKADLPRSIRDLLLKLAERFDERKFLPTLPDVRSFLDLKGPGLSSMKTRGAAVPFVFRQLSMLPEAKLNSLLNDRSYAGPSQLGPLSEAIKSSGTRLRASDEASDLSKEGRATTASPNRTYRWK
jgi:hypothetical protein